MPSRIQEEPRGLLRALGALLVAAGVGCTAPAPGPPAEATQFAVDAFVFTTPEPGVLPRGSEVLERGDLGIDAPEGGPIKGTFRVAKMHCETPALMQIQTDEGLFSLAIPRARNWDCGVALDQWRKVARTDTAIGLRYMGGPGEEQILGVRGLRPPETPGDDQGASVTLRVGGAWRAS